MDNKTESTKITPTFIGKNIYILFYRHGMNAGCQKGFFCEGDIKQAVQRAQRHCEVMGYRYIFVRPFVSDIEEEEKYKLEHH
jgi:hypothetical protein